MKQLLIAAVGGLLVLTACSAPQDPAPSPAPASAAPAAANEDPSGTMGGPELSPRGAKILEVGGPEATVRAKDGNFDLDFTVDAIRLDPQPCLSGYESIGLDEPVVLDEPVNGHRMAVDITVHTRPNHDRLALAGYPFYVFHYVDADGKVTDDVSPRSTSCKVTELPSVMLPGSTYSGTVMLDVPATSGTLVLDANGGAKAGGPDNTFEWAY